ncbi:2-succinyl-5-enolpyruvyl-6-hydroxy-3-cyclohexene-1-carboxylic-acid synthase [Nodosilinea sp. P-1105]|uniref:2-succinyl-5-enolpyruvyl-6-hydroxy-3- cyclohexene-1-carboxylic-acid synthase n=1 Tax=Nodosilinea sp. P-1105 TaxID=2546229 RepID=UPI00146D8230|nr:2-succinyl-5-enolpyruvyl-6-hydroxy-3-cyclohexene-1-carboxylic-acid synthase [Nodosilinea sp. P-1105]NMF83993.1 2-succinyl-5-enolpyruvyl-6-hydroxy-3-cyclohexene-1-carboxylic-acid synthase [Nodosilinea sp. P-1105]
MTLDFRNTNTLWASVLAETLARLGMQTVVISPGSRSTPLTVALASHPRLESLPILDERSAAFFALGQAKATGRPVGLVCTSGTAGANYYSAVIEAKESRVPLLVMTADRPPELRDCASGQTIDQQRLFGQFAQWYAELASPTADLAMLRYLRQVLVQAWQRSQWPVPGPVHLNCPFRDPLAPVADGSVAGLEATWARDFFEHLRTVDQSSFPQPVGPIPGLDTWLSCDRGLIIAGPAQPPNPRSYNTAVARLSQYLGWPVLADALSPLRHAASQHPYLVTTYDPILRQAFWTQPLDATQVIQLGSLPTSKVLRQWLDQTQPYRWVLDSLGANLDPLHGSVTPVPLGIEAITAVLPMTTSVPPLSVYGEQWLRLEGKVRRQLDTALADLTHLFEGKVPWLMAHCLPPGTPVVIANSLAIRQMEWFCPPSDRGLRPWCNRGANGIDGTLSTALGIAHQGPPTVLLTGDLALLHDTNGWLTLPQFQGHLTVVLINNQGGGIFEMLPISQFEPPFEDFFATPQQVNWSHLCATYGVNYEQIKTWAQLQATLEFLPTRGVRLLEIRCDRHQSLTLTQQLLNLE